jgi:dihydrofolate synthase/folylpolyglutamate synthase
MTADRISYETTRDYLYSLRNRGSKYGTERIQAFVAAVGNPERAYPSIHVAGTNGKGSVCAMLEAIFRANKFRTGMYTSPHLIHQGERIQIDRTLLSESDIVKYTEQLKPIAEALSGGEMENHPSFFEFMTVMAFLHFAKAGINIALIETGLGGRLDATNVLTPELSIITTIGLDHTDLLGDTIEKIAYEKAGIIKPGVPVLIGWLQPEAEAVIRQVATDRKSPFYSAREHFETREELPKTNLTGRFQQRNAALALYATEILSQTFTLNAEINVRALQSIAWRGRWETLQLDGRTLILDASHNAEGMRELELNLKALFAQTQKKPIVVASALGSARAEALIPILTQYASEIHFVTPMQERALKAEELMKRMPATCKLRQSCSSIIQILPSPSRCSLGQAGDTIVFTGSLYLIGEILQRITKGANPDQHTLQDSP